MKITIENTTKIIDLFTNISGGDSVPARIWEGETESGIKVIAYITRIAVANKDNQEQFEKELSEQRAPSEAVQRFSLRQIL